MVSPSISAGQALSNHERINNTLLGDLNPGSTEPATRFGCRDTQTGAPLKLG